MHGRGITEGHWIDKQLHTPRDADRPWIEPVDALMKNRYPPGNDGNYYSYSVVLVVGNS
jgi:hypothetical protein